MLNVIHILNYIIHIFYIFLIQQILEHEYNSDTVSDLWNDDQQNRRNSCSCETQS